YKKLIPTLRKFPEDIIVIADDDVIYPSDWLAQLIATHKKYPNAVIGHHIYRINLNKPYRKWCKIQNKIWRQWFFGRPSFKNFATGVGGILYPPHSLHPDVFNEKLFRKIAPTNDDVWFWAMTLLNGTKITIAQKPIKNLPFIANSQKTSLWEENQNGKNEKCLNAIIEHYPQLKKLI
ncbi:MAG: glycosyltransferase family 2 protein, partial [Alphaproteobacteria bacterium]|nr:glycosyltransferase family 2 protein [Alphaproteobacteria bacterium]